MLTEISEVPLAGLPLDAFKAHLRLGTGFSDGSVQDEVLESLFRAALAAIEARTSKAVLTREFELRLRLWTSAVAQVFPIAPVSSIVSLTRVDAEGAESAVDPGTYRLRADAHRPALEAAGTLLPAIPNGGEVRVRFIAGYAVDWDGVPPDLRQAVLLLAAHYYEYRAETALAEGCMPFGVSALIARYSDLRLGARA